MTRPRLPALLVALADGVLLAGLVASSGLAAAGTRVESSSIRALPLTSWRASSGGSSGPNQIQAAQNCAVRWNQMNMQWQPTLALVAARPCSITLAYSFSSKGTSLSGGKPCYGHPTQLLLGSKECIDTTHRFICTLNRFGAYVCPSHAQTLYSNPAAWNAKVGTTGTLTLDRPPPKTTRPPPPAWAVKYPVVQGYIVPYDSNGQLRPGLTLQPQVQNFDCPAFAQKTTVIYCPASVICFAPRLPLYVGEQVACPVEPGSRIFRRSVLQSP